MLNLPGWTAILLALAVFFGGYVLGWFDARKKNDPGLPEWPPDLKRFYIDKEDLAHWVEIRRDELVRAVPELLSGDTNQAKWDWANGQLHMLGWISREFDLGK